LDSLARIKNLQNELADKDKTIEQFREKVLSHFILFVFVDIRLHTGKWIAKATQRV
jgi:hypothetical protein